jgi:hypothetical protein
MITVPQMKKHLLLLNRLMRTELKKDIIPVPSKLSEEEINKYFERLFIKKTEGEEEYYVPIKSKVELKIDEELFKSLLVKKKQTKVELTPEEKVKMEQDRIVKVADVFIKSLINPYLRALKAGKDGIQEKKAMVDKYVKLKFNVKQNIKKRWAKLYESVLNPADVERTTRKERLKEEDKKMMKEIRMKAKEEKKMMTNKN